MKKTLLTNSELANFTSQMALILQAGISPYEGISIMVEDSDNDKTKQFLSSIEELLNQGETLYTSLQQTNAFSCLCFAYDSNRKAFRKTGRSYAITKYPLSKTVRKQ